jgi:putative ATP-dependent endonuclease of OLD family
MSILVDSIRINGFRGLKNIEISLPRITVLIGSNNSGKTSVLKALNLALGDYSRHIAEEDFHIGTDEERVLEIIVDVRIIASDKQGKRIQAFDDAWAAEFGDKIQAESNGNQFVAIRTRTALNSIKGIFECQRFTLEKWPLFKVWLTDKNKETKMPGRLESIPFISIEAQRDLHSELKEKNSFIGKLLSHVSYNKSDGDTLEALIKDINDSAVSKSSELKELKSHLEKLNHSFQGSGNAEITPFPKKIRDLSKHFSVHFGENRSGMFSMEYHGMGTRSWASMLVVKAFTDLMATKHGAELKPFFPILAAEEPEAHLHPNAQKTIYRQLAESQGQVIISTHSPYLAAVAKVPELRYLKKLSDSIEQRLISLQPGDENLRRLEREIIHSRGEMLFTKALVLCEGETEEQALPMLFQRYFDKEAFELGINIVGIGGAGNYIPFFTFARDFSIPIFIFSDGETNVVKNLKKHFDSIFGDGEFDKFKNVTILDGTDFEGYLLSTGFKETVERVIEETDGAGAITSWIEKADGRFAGRKKTGSPPLLDLQSRYLCERPP